MIEKLKPYPKYKDSGVEWLGQVPAHWEVRRLKHWLRINERVLPESTPADYEFDYLDIGSVGAGRLISNAQRLLFGNAPSRARRVVRQGDTIVSMVRTYLKAVYFVSKETSNLIVSTGFAVLTPSPSTQPKFVSYVSQSDFFTNQVVSDSVGIAYPAIGESKLAALQVAVPPFSEQTAIVRFLDYMDRRIRRYIRAKQRLIKLLEEYKQALIHQAVTGQMDVRTGEPYPAYKDSGVEWLGKVPEHWEVMPLKRLAWFKSGAGFPVHHQGDANAEIPFFKVSDMNIPGNEKYLRVCPNTVSMIVARSLGATVFPAGTIIFPKVGGALLTNKRRIAASHCCIDNNMMGCVARNGDRDFLFLMMSCIDLGKIAKVGPVPAISEGEVREIRVALPSAPEQTAIVEYLDTQTAKIDAAVAAARREIELLREYRTRLIADVVTGKVDVREVTAQLPEEPPEEGEWMDTEEAVEGEAADDEVAAGSFSEEEVAR